MDQKTFQIDEPANLRFLRRLVTLLTATMIFGLLAIFVVLVMRFSLEPSVPLPEIITLPSGATASAFTQGPNWYAVVTVENQILIFDRFTGDLHQTLQIRP
jgi:hypothetical protein